MNSRLAWKIIVTVLVAAVLALLLLQVAHAQQRLQRDGITLYRGLVPAAVVSQRHTLEAMHGVVPNNGDHVHHLVVALFRADGSRIVDAVVRAQLGETAITERPPKYLTPMPVEGRTDGETGQPGATPGQ